MPRYRLTLEYDGGPYKGFQAQGDLPTVQGAVERAVLAFSGESVRLQAAGPHERARAIARHDEAAEVRRREVGERQPRLGEERRDRGEVGRRRRGRGRGR